MSNISRGDASVMCPYYMESVKKCLTCKGGLDVDGKTVNWFATEEEKKAYMKTFCRNHYASCQIVKANDDHLGFERPETA